MHTGNALVSCICDAVGYLLWSVLQSCEWSGVFFRPTDVDNRRDYQCVQGTFVRGSSLSVVCTALVFILKFYMLSYTLLSVAVKCNAVHPFLIAPYSYNFMSMHQCRKMVTCRSVLLEYLQCWFVRFCSSCAKLMSLFVIILKKISYSVQTVLKDDTGKTFKAVQKQSSVVSLHVILTGCIRSCLLFALLPAAASTLCKYLVCELIWLSLS